MEKYKDRHIPIKERIADLLGRMSLREKVGQLNQKMYGWDAYHKTKDGYVLTSEFKDHVAEFDGMGALYGLFRADPWSGADFLTGIPAEDSTIVSQMVQKYIKENTRLGIPVLLSEESPHGHQGLDSTLLPTNIGAGASWNPALQERASSVVAQELQSKGVHLGLVSTLDISRDPRWGRTEECFSEDPYLASRMTEAVVSGMQGTGERPKVISVLKHFAAQGAGVGGHNSGPALIGERELREIFLPPMKAGVEAGALACMAAYNEIDGVPCHANHKLLTDILRKEWSFDGIVMADGQAIDRLLMLTGDHEWAAAYALKAGVDLSLWDEAYMRIEAAVKKGKVTEKVVNQAVSRVLYLKFKLGMFDEEDNSNQTKEMKGISPEETSLELARQSVVLLKNDDDLLPLNKNMDRIAVIGPNAHHLYNMLGDYTPPQRKKSGNTVLDGVRAIVSDDTEVLYAHGCGIRHTSKADFDHAIDIAERSDVAIVVLGGSSTRDFGMAFEDNGAVKTYQETEMDSGENVDIANLDLGGVQAELVQNIARTGTQIVLVLIQGRPHSISNINNHCHAILSAWYPGPQGGKAIADLLFGDMNPSGKLPISIPSSSMQLPVYYNYKDSGAKEAYRDMSGHALYPFGHGLSYTHFIHQFTHADTEKVTMKDLKASKHVTISVDVTNVGQRAGYEVVQLYIKMMQGCVTRRVKELKGFHKIWLNPQEKRTVHFELGHEELAIWNLDMHHAVEPGIVKLMVGGSSDTVSEKNLIIEQ